MDALAAMMQRLLDESRSLNERLTSIDNRVRGLEDVFVTVDFSDRTPVVAEAKQKILEVFMSTPMKEVSGEKASVPAPLPVPEAKPAEVSISVPPATPAVQFRASPVSPRPPPPPPPPPPSPPATVKVATSASAGDGDGDGSSEAESSSDDTNLYGATGLPKTPKESKGKKKKKIKHQISKMSSTHAYRRETIMEHSIKDASAKSAPVTVYGVQESYEHIRLRTWQPAAVLKFLKTREITK